MSRPPLLTALVVASLVLALLIPSTAQTPGKLLIAFASYRDRPMHSKMYLYEHDGVSSGTLIGSVDTVNLRQDTHPSLTADGTLCAFNLEMENESGKISVWNLVTRKLVEFPVLNESPNAQMGATISNDGRWIGFTAWNRPGASQRWDIFLFDTMEKKMVDLPGLNTMQWDERMPAISGDGRFIAYVSNSPGGVGLTDILVYDVREHKAIMLPDLNSKTMDIEPSMNHDGNLIAFVSDRPGGRGGRDIYLFDRAANKMLPLPDLNSIAHEQSPSLSPDGRFIAFVSERIDGAGERDIYLYDRQKQRLLPTPGLNAKQEDLDPCVVVLPPPVTEFVM